MNTALDQLQDRDVIHIYKGVILKMKPEHCIYPIPQSP